MEVLVKKCINAKNYALTVNKEYNVVEQGSYFVLTNDNNKNQRYHRNLFEDVVEVVEEVEAPLQITEWSIERNDDTIRVKVKLSNDENLINTTFGIEDYTSSEGLECCGLREIDGIQNFYGELLDRYHSFTLSASVSNVELPFSKEEFLKKCFSFLFDFHFGGMSIIISTVQQSVADVMDSLMNDYSMVKQEGINSNSSNHLYVYMVQKPESILS